MSCAVYLASPPARRPLWSRGRKAAPSGTWLTVWLCEACKIVQEFRGWTLKYKCPCPTETCDICDPQGAQASQVLN